MKKKIALIMSLVLSGFSFSQTLTDVNQNKYLIYLKDKGVTQEQFLSKSADYSKESTKILSERSIKRRSKLMKDSELINYEDLPLNKEYIRQLKNIGINIHNQLKWFNAVSVYCTEEQLKKLKTLDFIDKIEIVKKLYRKKEQVDNSPSTPESIKKTGNSLFDYGPSLGQYNLSGIPEVHDQGFTGKGVLIGILDSGFDWKNHESLQNAKVIAEHDFIFNDDVTANEPEDDPSQDNHGTFVFSVLGGYKEGKIVAPSFEAEFVLAKTEDIRSETHVEEDNYAAALEWMDSIGVDITSSSLGYSEFDKGVESYTYNDMDGKTTIVTKAAELAFQRGILTITSAGNEGDDAWKYITSPADGFNTIAVGAVNNKNQVAAFSSRGPSFDGRIKPDVVAQGVSVYGASTSGISSYSSSNGTSAACPIISGVAGLILSANPMLTNVELRNIIHQSSDSFTSPDNDRGYGLLSALKALSVTNQDTPNIIPQDYSLSKNYPNPFNNETKINFTALGNEHAELIIVDAVGQKVKTIFNGLAKPGTNVASWNGTNDHGSQCASGVYFYFLKIAGKDFGNKMVFLK